MEARLTDVTEEGYFVLVTKDDRKRTLKPEQLSDRSRERAEALATSGEDNIEKSRASKKSKEPDAPKEPEAPSNSGGISFF